MARRSKSGKDIPVAKYPPAAPSSKYATKDREEAKKFELLDRTQRLANQSCKQNDLTVLCGAAGTGKSLISIYSAYQLYKSSESPIDKIIIIRLAADTMGEHIGALPGEKNDKLMHLAAPIIDNFEQFCTMGEIKYMVENGKIETIPVSHTRGRSFRNCAIIVEEAQNLSDDMVLTILTRLGENSKLMITGDPMQCDFGGRNGMNYCLRLVDGLDSVGIFKFDAIDIKRHPLVKAIVLKHEELVKSHRLLVT